MRFAHISHLAILKESGADVCTESYRVSDTFAKSFFASKKRKEIDLSRSARYSGEK